MTPGDIYYAEQDDVYVLKFVGDIRYTMGCSLDELLDQQLARAELNRVIVDLRDADSVDSTSLGLLAKIANRMRERGKERVTLVSSNPDINEILYSMGFDDIFDICGGKHDECPPAANHLDVVLPAKENMTKTVLEAHSILSGLNEKNREMFSTVVGTLKGNLTHP